MRRPNQGILFAVLALALILIGGAELLKGALLIAKHEGDTLHLLDIVGRMAEGERIHQDFMTPIGVLAFAPIVLLLAFGVTAGKAMVLSQIIVAVLLLPGIWWVARRLPPLAAYLVGLYLIVMVLALTYGDVEPSLSMSMHYNRWAWALAYLALLPALVPLTSRRDQGLDGVLIGVAMAALVLLKITYFLAFLLPVVLALALRGASRTLVAALISGLVVAALATLVLGPAFWLAYIGDLRTVAESPMRTQPGQPLGNLAGGPGYLGVNLVLLLAVMLTRQAGEHLLGLVLLVLLPCVLYVVLQNYGNDPQWLMLLVVLLLTRAPAPEMVNGWGWNLRQAFHLAAAVAFAFTLPSALNMTYSSWRHLWLKAPDYVAMIPGDPRFADLATLKSRFATVNVELPGDGPGSGMEAYRALAERDKEIVTINGREVPLCNQISGLEAWYTTVAEDLVTAGYGGRRIFEADLFNVLWLYGDFPKLEGAAAWYYGGAPGIENAELVLVPDCAVHAPARKGKIEAIAAEGYRLEEVRQSPLYRLYSVIPPG